MTAVHDLQPVKASLVADLVGLININLADLLQVKARACMDCGGSGVVGDDRDAGASTLATCPTCGGVGAVEQFLFDTGKMKSQQFGRLIEGWDIKQGQIVPKMRSKDKAFAVLVKLLGFDKAIVEIANAAPFTESLPDEQRAAYVEQLKELAAMGLLDSRT